MDILDKVLCKVDVGADRFPATSVIAAQEVVDVTPVFFLGHVRIPQNLCHDVGAKLGEVAGVGEVVAFFIQTDDIVLSEEACVGEQGIEVREDRDRFGIVCDIVPDVDVVGDLTPCRDVLGDRVVGVCLAVDIGTGAERMREAALDRTQTDDDVVGRLGLADRTGIAVGKGIELHVRIVLGKFVCNRIDKADDRAGVRALLVVDCLAVFAHTGQLLTGVVLGDGDDVGVRVVFQQCADGFRGDLQNLGVGQAQLTAALILRRSVGVHAPVFRMGGTVEVGGDQTVEGMDEAADVIGLAAGGRIGGCIDAVDLQLGLEVVDTGDDKVDVAVLKDGNLRIARNRLQGEHRLFRDVLVVGGVEAHTEVFLEERIYAVECTACVTAGDEQLLADGFDGKAFLAECFFVELILRGAVGIADDELIIGLRLVIGDDADTAAGYFGQVVVQVVRRFDLRVGGVNGADDEIFGLLILRQNERVLVDDDRLLGRFLLGFRGDAGIVGVCAIRCVTGGKGEGTEQGKEKCENTGFHDLGPFFCVEDFKMCAERGLWCQMKVKIEVLSP